MYVCVYTYIHMKHISLYIYIYIYRERERDREIISVCFSERAADDKVRGSALEPA